MPFANKFASALHIGDIYDNGSKFGSITALRKNEQRSEEDKTLYVFGYFFCEVTKGKCLIMGKHYHHFGIPQDSLVLVRR